MSDLEEKLSALRLGRPAAVTVGTFDGVHLGHRRLLRSLVEEARAAGLASVVITFEEQPRSVIDPAARVAYLATLGHRTRLIEETGPDALLQVRFDEELRRQSADQFLAMLRRAADVRVLVAGPGARVGHDRLDAASLGPAADSHGIRIVEVPAERRTDGAGGDISSSVIRAALAAGNVHAAQQMLGRRYRIEGQVVTGDRRGRELGFPTANIQPHERLAIPANGIYATMISAGGQPMMAATSIGVRPTFETDGRPTAEVFLFDFEGDLYGETLRVEFVQRIRDERRFESLEALVDQLKRDHVRGRHVGPGRTFPAAPLL